MNKPKRKVKNKDREYIIFKLTSNNDGMHFTTETVDDNNHYYTKYKQFLKNRYDLTFEDFEYRIFIDEIEGGTELLIVSIKTDYIKENFPYIVEQMKEDLEEELERYNKNEKYIYS